MQAKSDLNTMSTLDRITRNYKVLLPQEIYTLLSKLPPCGLTELSKDVLLELKEGLYLGWKDTGVGWHSECLVLCDIKTNTVINIPSAEFTGVFGKLLLISTKAEKVANKPKDKIEISIDTNIVTISELNTDGKVSSMSMPVAFCSELAYAMLSVSSKVSTILRTKHREPEAVPHPNHAMIATKSENMNIVVFGLHPSTLRWIECSLTDLVQSNDSKFFLCHPKHKDACLHWLNGGQAEAEGEDGWKSARTSKHWDRRTVYMNPEFEIRIKTVVGCEDALSDANSSSI